MDWTLGSVEIVVENFVVESAMNFERSGETCGQRRRRSTISFSGATRTMLTMLAMLALFCIFHFQPSAPVFTKRLRIAILVV